MRNSLHVFGAFFVVLAVLSGCWGTGDSLFDDGGYASPDTPVVEEEYAPEEYAPEEYAPMVHSLSVIPLTVISAETGEKKIVAASIGFETEKEFAMTLKVGENSYTSHGTSHYFDVAVSVPTESFRYSIMIDDNLDRSDSVTAYDDRCDMFWSVGDITPDLSVFVPIMRGVSGRLGSYCGKLHIYLFARPEDRETFDKNVIFSFDEQTPAEILASIDAQYQKHEANLMRVWPLLTKEELRAVFIFNVVGSMWHFGNFIHKAAPGCVTVNEQIAPEDGDSIEAYTDDGTPIYFKWAFYDMPFFLESRIGCCTDHAYIQRLLFEAAGFTSRRIVTPGHWYAEAIIDGRWYTFDASFGVVVPSAVEDMENADEKTAYVFILPYMDEGWLGQFPFGIMDTLGVGWDMPVTDEYMYLYYRLIPGDI